jgi:DNA-binding response OmpR family regulator
MEFPSTEVVCARNGAAALRATEGRSLSLAILDLQMPELGGESVTRALRARAEFAETPIVILTAAGGPKEWQVLKGIGADRFLVKPIDLDDLVLIIRRIVPSHQETPSNTGPEAPPSWRYPDYPDS